MPSYGQEQQSCWRILWVPKCHKWSCWKEGKPTAWHLMPLNKLLGKQGCNGWFCDQKRFNPSKNRSVNVCPSVLFMSNRINSASLFFASLLYVVYQLLFVILPIVLQSHSSALHNYRFCFCLFLLLCSIIHYSITQCYFLFWYWKCIPGISISITTTILQFNKHPTTRLCHPLS